MRPALLALLVAGCHARGAARPPPPEAGAPAAVVADAAAAPRSIFVPVLQGPAVGLSLPVRGPLIAVDAPEAHAAYVLSADGTIRPVEPLAAMLETRPELRVGAVSGVWPRLEVELGVPAPGAFATVIETVVVDVERGVHEVHKLKGRVRTASSWSDGRVLGFDARDTTLDFSGGHGGGGELTLLSGPKPKALPKVPPGILTNGDFVAFDSGRIFLLGTRRPNLDPYAPAEMTHVWDYTDLAHPVAVELPKVAWQLVRGRNERETIILGWGYMMRFDGTSWVNLPVPDGEGTVCVSIGIDGSVWLITSPPMAARNTLWRARFPELQFEKVLLPPRVSPNVVVARDATDVWLTANRIVNESDALAKSEGNMLLHTQTQVRPLLHALPGREERR